MHAPHYIWLFLILFLSIPHYFVISNHIVLLTSKKKKEKNPNKFFSIKRNFKLTSNLKQNTPRIYPEPQPETRGIGFCFPNPRGMTHCHSPIPRGMEISGELASLRTVSKDCPWLTHFDRCQELYWPWHLICEKKFAQNLHWKLGR